MGTDCYLDNLQISHASAPRTHDSAEEASRNAGRVMLQRVKAVWFCTACTFVANCNMQILSTVTHVLKTYVDGKVLLRRPYPALTPCAPGYELQQLTIFLRAGGVLVKAAVCWRLIERGEDGPQREVTHGVATRRADPVVVVQQACHLPAEHVQNVTQRLAHQPVGAHHPCQSRVRQRFVAECVRLGTGRQDGDAPLTGVARHGSNDIVAHGTQECIWEGRLKMRLY